MQLCKHEPLRIQSLPYRSSQSNKDSTSQEHQGCALGHTCWPVIHSADTHRVCTVCQAQFWGLRMLRCIKESKTPTPVKLTVHGSSAGETEKVVTSKSRAR